MREVNNRIIFEATNGERTVIGDRHKIKEETGYGPEIMADGIYRRKTKKGWHVKIVGRYRKKFKVTNLKGATVFEGYAEDLMNKYLVSYCRVCQVVDTRAKFLREYYVKSNGFEEWYD